VLFNPKPLVLAQAATCTTWICQNKATFYVILACSIIAFIIAAYSTTRVYRYIGKYRQQKVRLDNMKHKLNEL